ncbi:MAG TPA: hypothetical protein DER02_06465 [Gammaproteobacteria bacterium]|nr:hypothetical protein [Gammaproteobacteria bacterium]|tara:strand:- start:652 stop:867 length:216 start_codon:yes stop_codon:yes gene_type:complete
MENDRKHGINTHTSLDDIDWEGEQQSPHKDDGAKFRVGRLLGVIFLTCVALAVISFLVDWFVIGPLEGRIL